MAAFRSGSSTDGRRVGRPFKLRAISLIVFAEWLKTISKGHPSGVRPLNETKPKSERPRDGDHRFSGGGRRGRDDYRRTSRSATPASRVAFSNARTRSGQAAKGLMKRS